MKRPLILVAFLLRVLVLQAHEDKLTEGYWQIAGKHGMAVSNHGAFENETNLYLEKQDIADPAQAWSFIKVGEGEFNIAKPDAYKSSGGHRHIFRTEWKNVGLLNICQKVQ